MRFAGSFVLYNYARLANLVRNFEKACSLGERIASSDPTLFAKSNKEQLYMYICPYAQK